MESTELEAEGEALRRTLERIEFLLKQGFISEEDAACRKQGAMDNFCLAPMIDRRRRLQTEAGRVTFGAGRENNVNVDLAGGGNIASLSPAAAGAGLSAVDSDPPTCSLSSGGNEVLANADHVPPGGAPPSSTESTERAESCGNPDSNQSKRRRMTEGGEGESKQLLVVKTSGLLLGSTPTSECEAPGCHLIPTCGHAGGNGNVRVCTQHAQHAQHIEHRSTEVPNALPVFAPAEPEDPEGPEDPKDQQGPDNTTPLKVPDVPMQSRPQPQPQLQPQPQPQRHPQPQAQPQAQPPPMTRETCTTDLPAPRATSTSIINSIINSGNSGNSVNSSSDLSMDRPTEPRLLIVGPEGAPGGTGKTVSSTNSTTVTTGGKAVNLAPAPPGLLAATNPTPTPTVRISASTCEGISSTESGGDSTACGGLPARSKPLPERTVQMQMTMQMPSAFGPVPADLKRGSCEWRECAKEPHYAVKGQRARTCFGHKEEDWVHVSRRRCDKDGCPRGAYFSLQGSTALFCSAHRTPGMLDVVNLRRYKCHTEDCQRQAYYNFVLPAVGLSRSKAKFCSTHKLPDMLNVRHRLCENEGCRTTPTYSFAGDRPRFCASHKTEAMVDTKSKTCAYADSNGSTCLKCRLYGLPDGKATYCFAHKSDGMINVRQARKRKSA